MVPGAPGLTGQSVPRSVAEELRPGRGSVQANVTVMMRPLNRHRIATQSSAAGGFPGISGQSAPGSVVAEPETELEPKPDEAEPEPE